MVITMGEILFHKEIAPALGSLGPDLVLHLRALYADPRGYNWRNDLAHGLVAAEQFSPGMLLWVVHSILLLGAWLKPASEASTPPLSP
jgi:lysyl-tRNA synthetase class 1